MFRQFQDIVVKKWHNLTPATLQLILEKLLINKYGSIEAVQAAFDTFVYENPDKKDLTLFLEYAFPVSALKKLYAAFEGVSSFQDLISFAKKMEDGENLFNLSYEELVEVTDISKDNDHCIAKLVLGIPGNSEPSNLFVANFAKKVRFSLKEIRDEIGISQETFKKWLQYFFKDRFDGVRTIGLMEYIEIYKQLLLKEEEHQFNFEFDCKEYNQRIESGLIFTKERLARLTESDYKTLKKHCEDIVPNYQHLDVYPYRIAMKIIERMG